MYPLNFYIIISHRIVSSITAPYTTKVEDGCSTTECFKGLYADVFHELSQILNFTFTISLVESYGSKFSNDTWSGMIGIKMYFALLFCR